jgi:hypothetical protein
MLVHSLRLQAVVMFTELIRENFRNSKLKQCLLPPLGELLYLIATQVTIYSKAVPFQPYAFYSLNEIAITMN